MDSSPHASNQQAHNHHHSYYHSTSQHHLTPPPAPPPLPQLLTPAARPPPPPEHDYYGGSGGGQGGQHAYHHPSHSYGPPTHAMHPHPHPHPHPSSSSSSSSASAGAAGESVAGATSSYQPYTPIGPTLSASSSGSAPASQPGTPIAGIRHVGKGAGINGIGGMGGPGTMGANAAARKQNSACDACRSRKVRCHKLPGEAKCAHCKSKAIECTTYYVTLATNTVKRPPKRSKGGQDGDSGSASGGQDDKTSHLIKYLFLRDAEYDHRTPNLSYLSISPSYRATHESGSPSGSPAKPVPTTAAESRLLNSSVRADLVSDLIETFFNIVHIRMPLLNPTFFRMRYHGQDPEGCPSDALLAVVIAWGAKFSENPIIVADRQESLQDHQRQIGASPNATDARVRGKSRIAEDLVLKAQEVLERAKVHRIASVENVQAMLLIEPLFRQYPRRGAQHNTPDSFRGFWAMASVRHLFELRVNKRETMSEIEDPQLRGEIIFAWWMACMVDATSAAFFRRKPLIEQDDYTVEPPCGDPNSTQEAPHPLASLQQYMIWYESAHDMAEIFRVVCKILWKPHVALRGVSFGRLTDLISRTITWRETHLHKVGVPTPSWPAHWDFVAAVTACSSDINYHVAWILIWQALDEFGIEELKRSSSTNSPSEHLSEIEAVQAQVTDEALAGALRIAALTNVLSSNGYLRLDPNVMHFSVHQAGLFLLRFKRPELLSIIEGLRQYGQSFEEAYEQADELERLSADYLHVPPSSASASASGGFNSATSAGTYDMNMQQQQQPRKDLSSSTATGTGHACQPTPPSHGTGYDNSHVPVHAHAHERRSSQLSPSPQSHSYSHSQGHAHAHAHTHAHGHPHSQSIDHHVDVHVHEQGQGHAHAHGNGQEQQAHFQNMYHPPPTPAQGPAPSTGSGSSSGPSAGTGPGSGSRSGSGTAPGQGQAGPQGPQTSGQSSMSGDGYS